jgi:hypothetical protein
MGGVFRYWHDDCIRGVDNLFAWCFKVFVPRSLLLEYQRKCNPILINPTPFSIAAICFPVNGIEDSIDLFDDHFLYFGRQIVMLSQELDGPFGHLAFIAEFRCVNPDSDTTSRCFDFA